MFWEITDNVLEKVRYNIVAMVDYYEIVYGLSNGTTANDHD